MTLIGKDNKKKPGGAPEGNNNNKKGKKPFNVKLFWRRTALIIYDIISIFLSSFLAILVRYNFNYDAIPYYFINPIRNLLPVISIEGGETSTDGRRGAGIYQILLQVMEKLKSKGLPFGVSITVTTDNLEEITDTGFLRLLRDSGCKMVLYVDYVATGEDDVRLEPDDEHRERMDERLDQLRQDFDRMVFLAFPGDEKEFGGCLAAGRGFFHISAEGDAEPCPFAPFSDINVRESSVREAIRSRLFARLDERDMLQEDHSGGCALAGKGVQVQELLK